MSFAMSSAANGSLPCGPHF